MPEASGTLLTHSDPSAFRPRKEREVIVDIDADVDQQCLVLLDQVSNLPATSTYYLMLLAQVRR